MRSSLPQVGHDPPLFLPAVTDGNYRILELISFVLLGRLSCVDIAEVNPSLGNERDNQITVNSALQIITHCFGGRRQGVYPKNYQIPIPTHVNHVAPPPS